MAKRQTTIKLANGKKFGTRFHASQPWVSDILKKEQSVVLTIQNGAQKFKRAFALWYVEISE